MNTVPRHIEGVSDTDLTIFMEQQKTRRTIIRWAFGGGIFLTFCLMVTIAGLAS